MITTANGLTIVMMDIFNLNGRLNMRDQLREFIQDGGTVDMFWHCYEGENMDEEKLIREIEESEELTELFNDEEIEMLMAEEAPNEETDNVA